MLYEERLVVFLCVQLAAVATLTALNAQFTRHRFGSSTFMIAKRARSSLSNTGLSIPFIVVCQYKALPAQRMRLDILREPSAGHTDIFEDPHLVHLWYLVLILYRNRMMV